MKRTGSKTARAGVAMVAVVGTLLSTSASAASDRPTNRNDDNRNTSPSGKTAPIEVVIRGKRKAPPVSRRDPTVSSTVIDRQRLLEPGTTVQQTLRSVAGVQVHSAGGASDVATASLRGMTSAQTPVYLAGIVLNDEVTGTADLSLIAPWMLERVEIYRGHAPMFSDRSSMGGAVYLVPVRPRGPRMVAGVGLGSFGEERQWVMGQVGRRKASALLAYRRATATNDYPFSNDRGTRFDNSDDVVERRKNAWLSDHDFWAIGSHEPTPTTRVTMLVHTYDRWQGVTGLATVPALHASMHARRIIAGISTLNRCADQSACTLRVSTTALSSLTDLRDPFMELAVGSTQATGQGRRLVQRVQWTQRVGRVRLQLSGRQSWETLALYQRGRPTIRSRRSSSVASAGASWRVSAPWMVTTLASMEHDETAMAEGASRTSTLAAARAGARYKPWRHWALTANVGRAARPPTLGELYGVTATVRGNSSLRAEQSWSVDFGALWTRSAPLQSIDEPEPALTEGFAQLAAFATWSRDLIAYRRSSFGVVKPYNVGSARVLGIEAAAGASFWRRLRLGGNVTLLDPRDTTAGRLTSNDWLPFRAPLVAHAEATLQQRALFGISAIDQASLGARFGHRSSQFADPAGLILMPAQNSLDLLATLALLKQRYIVRAVVVDSLDSPQVDLIGYPRPGRSFHVSMEMRWP